MLHLHSILSTGDFKSLYFLIWSLIYLMLQPLLLNLLDKRISKVSFDISLSGIYQDKSTTKNVKRIFFGISYISINNYLRKNNYQNLCCLCSKLKANLTNHFTLSWRRPLSYRNQSIDLLRKLMNWFLYDNGLRHERVKRDVMKICVASKA